MNETQLTLFPEPAAQTAATPPAPKPVKKNPAASVPQPKQHTIVVTVTKIDGAASPDEQSSMDALRHTFEQEAAYV